VLCGKRERTPDQERKQRDEKAESMRQRQLAVLGVMVWTVAAACRPSPGPVVPLPVVRPGLEVLVTDSVHLVRGLRVGLVSNQAGVDRRGVSGVDVLRAGGVNLVALFSAEHGFRSAAAPGEAIPNTVDSATGLPIYSLYGATPLPTDAMFEGLDLILIDLQDVGVRYFSWLGTTVTVMQAAAKAHKRVLILDRPNPIGEVVQGNVLEVPYASMVGRLAVPIRHGMTMGELARLANNDLHIGTDLGVVPVAGWRRAWTFDRTGLPFVPPSPNLRDLEAFYHYAGTCLFEGTALSVGRGSDLPFHQVGAPWLDTTAVLLRLRSAGLRGVAFEGASFVPRAPGDGKYPDTPLMGIRLRLTDPSRYDPVLTGITLLAAVRAVHPDRIGLVPRQFDRLAGGPGLREALERGEDPAGIEASWRGALAAFRARREPFLLYP